MTKLCLNPTARYVIVWRTRLHGKRYGRYHWVSPASIRRLIMLTETPLWRRTHQHAGEHYLEQVTL